MKKFIMNNMFVIIITTILFLCIATIGYVVATYFFGGSDTVYGDRLDKIGDYTLSNSDLEDIQLVMIQNDDIVDAQVRINGNIIYMSSEFIETVSLSAAKKYATSFLELFDEDILNYYDINYTVYSTEYTLMGYKNSSSKTFVWNNNTSFEVESE